ncbi:Gfo/Idh/MocA family oxidoreductase [Vibrio sp.]|uniref:Gfo/Idh/MocA family protein n=1 Tax=Vibrio sp. TaxID=678 RepID=UPI00311F809D
MLRWGILGLGNIANRVASDFTHVYNGELVAVSSRSKKRAKDFSDTYDVGTIFTSYELLIKSDNVEAIYIATIHSSHYELARACLKHGKHVMVEKPAVTSPEQWEELTQLAKENHCFLMEAMKFPLFPAYQELKALIKKELGRVNNISACFGNYHRYDSCWHLFDKQHFGGAKYDVGCYLAWLYVDLLEVKNKKSLKLSRIETRVNDKSQVDERTDFFFSQPSQAILRSSIVDDYSREASITTEKANIKIHGKWWNPKKIEIYSQQNNHIIDYSDSLGGGFHYEFNHFAECISLGLNESPILTHKKTYLALTIIDSDNYVKDL